ncbi:hypothetical protein SAMN05192583_0866 [Sphingomonas gellani]|uniref:Uncharacterized protein n=1 Tax=Sphingomonas gellani TaxID=1166340 RepID=A0A1H7ZVC5_9SPHN|nr:hypothetical protein [Sphingomonas gellani]SEM62271.1 hypothetical protein SAMN05192583_0866 [Sphingomonas gellani]
MPAPSFDLSAPAAIIPQPALSLLPASYDPLDLVTYPEVLPISMPCAAHARTAPRFKQRSFLPSRPHRLSFLPLLPGHGGTRLGELSATVARLRARDAQVLAFSQPTGGEGGPDPLEPDHERPIGYYARRIEVAFLGLAALGIAAQFLRAYIAGVL